MRIKFSGCADGVVTKRSFRRCISSFMFSALLILVSTPASAESRREPASGLADQAEEALKKPDLPKARELLYAALGKSQEPRLLCMMGRLAKAMSRASQSYDFFRRCLEEAGAELNEGMRQEAVAATQQAPNDLGEVVGYTKRGGFLWVDDILAAHVRPGESVHLTLAVGRHSLRLKTGTDSETSGSARADQSSNRDSIQILVPSQNVCDVDLERGQVACSVNVLLLPFDAAGALPVSRLLSQSEAWWPTLAASLKKDNGRLISLSRLRPLFKARPQGAKCLSRPQPSLSCQIEIGRLAEASYVLGLRINPDPVTASPNDAQARDYQLYGWLIETHVGKQTEQQEQLCTRCNNSDLEKKILALLGQVFASGQRPARSVDIISTPGATVTVDNEARGLTPLQLWLFPGEHVIAFSRPYFQSMTQHIQVLEDTASDSQQVRVSLLPAPMSQRERALRSATWATGSLGMASLAIGLGLFFNPDAPQLPLPAMDGQDAQPGLLISTRIPGIAVMAAGGVLLTTTIVLVALDRHAVAQRRVH